MHVSSTAEQVVVEMTTGGNETIGVIEGARFRGLTHHVIRIRIAIRIPEIHTPIVIHRNAVRHMGTRACRSTTATRTGTTRDARMRATTTRSIRRGTAAIVQPIGDTTDATDR